MSVPGAVWAQFGEDGSWPTDETGAANAAKGMPGQLAWWTRGLRQARAAHPYGS